jgi:hypothetical protein
MTVASQVQSLIGLQATTAAIREAVAEIRDAG